MVTCMPSLCNWARIALKLAGSDVWTLIPTFEPLITIPGRPVGVKSPLLPEFTNCW